MTPNQRSMVIPELGEIRQGSGNEIRKERREGKKMEDKRKEERKEGKEERKKDKQAERKEGKRKKKTIIFFKEERTGDLV